jgi:hypothetical protein
MCLVKKPHIPDPTKDGQDKPLPILRNPMLDGLLGNIAALRNGRNSLRIPLNPLGIPVGGGGGGGMGGYPGSGLGGGLGGGGGTSGGGTSGGGTSGGGTSGGGGFGGGGGGGGGGTFASGGGMTQKAF